MLFTLSAIMTLWVAFGFARRLASGSSDVFWIVLGATASQIGSIAVVTSLAHALTPLGWILAQAALALGSAALFRVAWPLARRGSPVVVGRARINSLGVWLRALPPLALAGLACVVALVLCSAVTQAWTPILGTDERMYHASRVIYWIQHHSLFPYETHNDRQNVFPFGSELFFLWPVLLTNSEGIARMVCWLGYPLAAIAAYILLRTLRLTPTSAIAGALVLVSTPIVAES